MSQSDASGHSPERWSIEGYQAFWANPDPSLIKYVVTDDVLGDWPGDSEPVRGVGDYVSRIEEVLRRVPDLKLEVAEHAQNGDFVFIRWIAKGTGAEGKPFEFSGIDRLRLRDGRVAENIVRYDSALFDRVVR